MGWIWPKAVVMAGGAGIAAALWLRRARGRELLSDLSRPGPRPRVVILGTGFGGVAAASALASAPVDTVVVDRNNYHLFSPLLYQVAASVVQAVDVTHPARVIARDRGFAFREAEVLEVDLVHKRLRTSNGDLLFDYLIAAPGSVPAYFGVPGAEQHALPLKTVTDATRIRNRVIGGFERAEWEQDADRRRALLTVAIVGGGPTGLELAGALTALAGDVAGKEYPGLRREEIAVHVFEATAQVLPGFHDDLRQLAVKRLRERGVVVELNAAVAEVEPGALRLKDGRRLQAETIVWAAGVQGSRLVETLPGERGRDGRLRVLPTLQVEGAPNVFVVGDAASITMPDESRPVPAVAPAAIQQGQHAARNVRALLAGREPEPFVYHDRGSLVILGRHAGAADIGGLRYEGIAAWATWRLVHLAWLTGAQNKLGVLQDWAQLYLGSRETARIPV